MKKFKPLLIAGAIVLLIWGIFSLFPGENPQIVKGKEALYQTENTGNFEAQFGLKENQKKIIFKTKNSSIGIEIPTERAEWIREGEKLKVTQGPVDFIYSLLNSKKGEPQGIKEEIILNKRVDTNVVFQFPISLEKLNPKKEDGIWHFYNNKGEDLFYIPKPFMVDDDGVRSERVQIKVEKNKIKVIPDTSWLQEKERKYPVMIDPSLKLTVIDVYSHPQTGDTWSVSFETEGEEDLKIIPADQATIDDMDFTSLLCGDTEMDPQILENDVIYYPNWNCDKEAEVNHYIKKEGEHKLRFEFGDEVTFAYNDPDTVTDPFNNESKLSSLEQTWVDSDSGTMKLSKPGFCNDGRDKNTTTTLAGDIVYCDNYIRMWTITANVDGSADSKQWYTSSTDTADSCIGQGSDFEACHYCDTLTYAGYSDWELPSCTNDDNLPDSCVLYQLGESACGWTGTDGSEDTCTPSWDPNAQSSYYWSSTEYSGFTDSAWYVYFNNGVVSSNNKDNTYAVRCVRGQ